MNELFICSLIILLFLLLFFLYKKKKRVSDKEKIKVEEAVVSIKEKKKEIIKEFEMTVMGTQENAKRTSRNRQMILMDMGSYDTVFLEEGEGNIWVLNENGHDIGYLKKEDKELISPYINNNDYSIETGVERFFRNEQGENLIIYTTILGFV